MDEPRVASVMTPFPHSVDGAENLRTARAMMEQHGFHHLPVMRDGALAGIVSARDLEIALASIGTEVADEVPRPVWAICQRDPYVVELDRPLPAVVEGMADRQIGSALVTRKGKLAGIITMVDICRAFARLLRGRPVPDVPA